MNFKSPFLQEFSSRGFFAQATHLDALDDLMSKEKITAYIGFDCTAKSLHAGSLIQIMILRLLQKHGHKAIILLGGGTTKIGDPSGKDEARKILSDKEIQENCDGIKKTLAKFIDIDSAIFVNNDDWLKDLKYIEFLRDYGKHFSVNRMLTFDSVKLRLEREQPLSFLEFNYMILQAYDFYELNKKYNCRLQIGGSDQWGNIVNGVELTRKVGAKESSSKASNYFAGMEYMNHKLDPTSVFGLTSQLLTTADGKKMGKTAEGAVWLDSQMLSPFDYFQYFRNADDRDVGKFLKLFTDLEILEIEKLENLKDQEINFAKERLAFEATKICHGEDEAEKAKQKAKSIFATKNSDSYEKKEFSLHGQVKKLTEIIKEIGAADSLSSAKKLIEGKGVKINGEAVLDINLSFDKNAEFDLSIGKKKFFKIIIKS